MKKLFTLVALTSLMAFPLFSLAAGPISTREMDKVIKKAQSFEGTPYKYGGVTRRGMDCSGLMVKSFASIGYDLPRVSRDQQRLGEAVSKKNIKKGDLIFFAKGRTVNHVGLVTSVKRGDVRFIHSTTSKGVITSSLSENYWRKRYHSAKRLWASGKAERKNKSRKEEPALTTITIEKTIENISAESRDKKRDKFIKKSAKKGQKEALKEEKEFIRYEEKKRALAKVKYPGRFPEASQRDLSLAELRRMDPERLTLMKYEILARHGFVFTSPTLQRYFGMQDWYREIEKEKSQKKIIQSLSSVEKANIQRIRSIEQEKGTQPESDLLIKKKNLMRRN